MNISGVLETGIYVADVGRAKEFYVRLFGFPVLVGDDRFCALAVAGRQVLLLFRTGSSTTPMPLPGGGTLPPHDGSGTLHFAFSIEAADLAGWEARLHDHGVEIESRVTWPRGGTSLYFRDPDGHLGELVTPGCWAIY